MTMSMDDDENHSNSLGSAQQDSIMGDVTGAFGRSSSDIRLAFSQVKGTLEDDATERELSLIFLNPLTDH